MLQFISHRNERVDELQGIKAVLEGGCRWVQLRMKDATEAEFLETGRKAAELCRGYGAKLILDDRVDLVEQLDADGVHLGKKDMPVDQARKILGNNRIIGATANTFEDIVKAASLGADYIGLGPFRFTTTKKGLSPVLGLEGYAKIMKACHEAGISLPVVAIGGILREDIPAIMATGVTGIALSGALLNADDIAAETTAVISTINTYNI